MQFALKRAPVAKSVKYSVPQPKIVSRGPQVTISHTEYIADIISQSTAFTPNVFRINPGIAGTFPWLSQVAGVYERYNFKKLHFMYKPICSTTTPGKAILAVDYDAADSAPNSKLIMNSYESTVSCSVWDEITHVSTASNLTNATKQRYTRTQGNSLPANVDIRLYDAGNLIIATSNTPEAITTLGELYVTYEVELMTPQLNNTVATGGSNTEPNVSSGAIHMLKILVDASGIPSLDSYFTGKPLWLIANSLPKPGVTGRTIVDLVMNPTITDAMKMDYKTLAGNFLRQFGDTYRVTSVTPTYTGSNLAIDPSFTFDLTPTTTTNNGGWVVAALGNSTSRSLTPGTENLLSGIRLDMSNGSLLELNAYTLSGNIPVQEFSLENQPTVGLPSPTPINTYVNWQQFNTLPAGVSRIAQTRDAYGSMVVTM